MSEHALCSRRVTTTSDSSARCASSSKKGCELQKKAASVGIGRATTKDAGSDHQEWHEHLGWRK